VRRKDWLLHQLPVGMLDDPFLVRFMGIFQEVADTVHLQVETLPHMFDPTVAPDAMVRQMGRWLGLAIDSSLPHDLQRRLVMEYSQIVMWRGTRHGMERMLVALTGRPAVVEDNGGVFAEGEAPSIAPHVKLSVETAGHFTQQDMVRFVQAELPASVTFELHIGGRQVWPPVPEGGQDAPVLQEVG
jgi:phage tail-like protein